MVGDGRPAALSQLRPAPTPDSRSKLQVGIVAESESGQDFCSAPTDNTERPTDNTRGARTTPLPTPSGHAGDVKLPSSARSRFALIDALNAEWDDLGRDPVLAAHGRSEICRWARQHEPLRACRTPSDVLAAIRADPDPVLAALIVVHQCRRTPAGATGDHLAGRIVLQTMLGKIVTMAARDRQHAVEDYVGQLWARIGEYPLAQRPHRIAANIALDTLKAVTCDTMPVQTTIVPVTAAQLELAVMGRRPYGSGEPPGGRVPGSSDQIADLTARRVLRTAEDLGLIDAQTRRLLLSVYAEGLSSADAARRHGLTPTTVRFRCSRAIRRMAQHAMSIADAA